MTLTRHVVGGVADMELEATLPPQPLSLEQS